MPTYEVPDSVYAEYGKLTRSQRAAFRAALRALVEALSRTPPQFPRSLRVKRVQGHPGVWELSWAADGRATFQYGESITPGQPHVVWRRIGGARDPQAAVVRAATARRCVRARLAGPGAMNAEMGVQARWVSGRTSIV